MQATADVKGQEKVAERGGEGVEIGEGCCKKKKSFLIREKEIRQTVLPFNN